MPIVAKLRCQFDHQNKTMHIENCILLPVDRPIRIPIICTVSNWERNQIIGMINPISVVYSRWNAHFYKK